MELDIYGIFDGFINTQMAQNKQLAPVLKVLNRYGIYGLKVTKFLIEFEEACKEASELEADKDGE